jgi:hypothetical protein
MKVVRPLCLLFSDLVFTGMVHKEAGAFCRPCHNERILPLALAARSVTLEPFP